MRKWRQFLCRDRCNNYQATMRDLRAASCRNKGSTSLITVLKSELECGWSSANTETIVWLNWSVAVAIGMVFVGQLQNF